MPLIWDAPRKGASVPPEVAAERRARIIARRSRANSDSSSDAAESIQADGPSDSDIGTDEDSQSAMSVATSNVSDVEVEGSIADSACSVGSEGEQELEEAKNVYESESVAADSEMDLW